MYKTLFIFLIFSLTHDAISQTAKLKKVNSRGWYNTEGPYAEFNINHPSVEVWSPDSTKNAPIIIYAHGGAGFREDDSLRVVMMRENGFATISFDAYEMNGLDWNFVTRRVTNSGKQNLIWNVFKGALDYVQKKEEWKTRSIFLYGASNGGRVVLFSGSELNNPNIKGIISEAPAATGYALGDCKVPTIVLFGGLDTWAGKSDTDFVWKRTFPNSPISIKNWIESQQSKGHPIKFIFYENAGHLMFEGSLKQVTVRRGDKIAFTAYQGAEESSLLAYKKDVLRFILDNKD